jgi:CTD small phosphatase-like protein 2
VVKRDGLYLRRIKRDNKGQRLYGDELRMVWIGGTNYHPVKEDP